ncbi:MAG: glucosaminidase domain-containing protein [Campylobacterota bacterium]|nr:glucosaminidase domain-containing protein [Campylobacterota bacterium]
MRTLLIVFIVWIFLGCEGKSSPQDSNVSFEKEENYSSLKMPILSVIDETHLSHRTVYTSSMDDIYKIFDDIGYDNKKWYEGLQIIPRVYLQHISNRWREQSSEISVQIKKDIFFKLITPAILRTNELIQIERNHLIAMARNPHSLNDEAESWLLKTSKKYKLIKKDENLTIDDKLFEDLLMRVDTIAPSLALAQAAEESGWGTSRFASEGNALFGQWTTSKTAMIPSKQRSQFSNFGLARFKTPQASVNSYMLNLNTHNAYKKLREKRFELRKEGKVVTGLLLSETLDKYSERGEAYVKGLKKMITYNHLAHFDTARLWTQEVIIIAPKASPKKIEKILTKDMNQSDLNSSN